MRVTFRQFAIGLLVCALMMTGLLAEQSRLSETVYLTEQEALAAVFDLSRVQVAVREVTFSHEQKARIEAALGTVLDPASLRVFEGRLADGRMEGYAWILDELGKYYPITLIVKVTPAGTIAAVRVMVYRESIGAEVRKSRFLRQFKGKTLSDPLRVDYDVNGISGATISSWSVASAARKALVYTRELK